VEGTHLHFWMNTARSKPKSLNKGNWTSFSPILDISSLISQVTCLQESRKRSPVALRITMTWMRESTLTYSLFDCSNAGAL